jgi:hypothetical protein
MPTAPDQAVTLTGLGWEPGSVLVLRDAGGRLGRAVAAVAAAAGLTVAVLDPATAPDSAVAEAAMLGPLRHLLVADAPPPEAGAGPADAGMAEVAALMAVTEAWLRAAGDAALSAVFVTRDTGGLTGATDPAGTRLVTPAAQGYARHLAHRLGGRTRFNTVVVPARDQPAYAGDTARAALFLLSPAASYVTGTSLATGGVVSA